MNGGHHNACITVSLRILIIFSFSGSCNSTPSVMESELSLLRGVILRVLKHARRENREIFGHCNSLWRNRLREKSYASLSFALKFVMSSCELGTIVGLFQNGKIPKTRECIRVASFIGIRIFDAIFKVGKEDCSILNEYFCRHILVR